MILTFLGVALFMLIIEYLKLDKTEPTLEEGYLYNLEYVSGLKNLIPNEVIECVVSYDNVVISGSDIQYKLNPKNITNARYAKYVGSIDKTPLGKAVAGGVLFGTAGAVVGGQKQSVRKKMNLGVINYMADGEELQIVLTDEMNYTFHAINAIKEVAEIEDDEVTIEL